MRFKRVLMRVSCCDEKDPTSFSFGSALHDNNPFLDNLLIFCNMNPDVVFVYDGREIEEREAAHILQTKKDSSGKSWRTSSFWIKVDGELIMSQSQGPFPWEVGYSLTPSRVEFLTEEENKELEEDLADFRKTR